MPIPRYASLATRVAREIRKQLKSEYITGGKLPSEHEMAAQFGVSRGTVRQALTILEREGVIFRRQGSGTFVNKYVLRIQARAEIAYEFTELLSIAGYEAGIHVLALEHCPVSNEIAELMELEPECVLLTVQKLFLADGQPAIYCIDYLPEHLICTEYEPSELKQPIFEFLKQRCGRSINMNLTEIIPELADEHLAYILDVQPGEPLLRFDEIGYEQSGQPALFSRIYFKDQYIRFTMLRKRV